MSQSWNYIRAKSPSLPISYISQGYLSLLFSHDVFMLSGIYFTPTGSPAYYDELFIGSRMSILIQSFDSYLCSFIHRLHVILYDFLLALSINYLSILIKPESYCLHLVLLSTVDVEYNLYLY